MSDMTKEGERGLPREQLVPHCPTDGWVQKKAGKMLLPDSFSLVATFCKVPVQKEIFGVRGSLRKSEASSFQERGTFLWRDPRELQLPLRFHQPCLSQEMTAISISAL